MSPMGARQQRAPEAWPPSSLPAAFSVAGLSVWESHVTMCEFIIGQNYGTSAQEVIRVCIASPSFINTPSPTSPQGGASLRFLDPF